jgi:nucleoside-diphosphate-sugar epimerase
VRALVTGGAGFDLGWAPSVTLADGLRRTVDWFASHGG